MKPIIHTLFAAILSLTAAAHAQSNADHAAHHHPVQVTTASTPTSEGEVRKIDNEQGKITLKHGPIANLNMPGMTMVFKVADPKLLQGIKAGDTVRFTAESIKGVLRVTAITAQ